MADLEGVPLGSMEPLSSLLLYTYVCANVNALSQAEYYLLGCIQTFQMGHLGLIVIKISFLLRGDVACGQG